MKIRVKSEITKEIYSNFEWNSIKDIINYNFCENELLWFCSRGPGMKGYSGALYLKLMVQLGLKFEFWAFESGEWENKQRVDLKFFRASPRAQGPGIMVCLKNFIFKKLLINFIWNIYQHFWTLSPQSLGLKGIN